MEQIIDLLHEKGCSCVIKNNDEIREYNRRGVIDIYELINNDPKFLKGAFLADKVIGKVTAALLIKGEVNKV